jgi:hypothetical protein
MRMARAMDHRADRHEDLLVRLVTAVGKYWICKRTPGHAYEAMECIGGSGVMEDSPFPRLFRESPVNAIWEGSGNVQCLDVLRAMQKTPAVVEAFFRHGLPCPQRGGPHGAGHPGGPAGATRACRCGGCLLRIAPGGRRPPQLRHAAPRRGLRRHHPARNPTGLKARAVDRVKSRHSSPRHARWCNGIPTDAVVHSETQYP